MLARLRILRDLPRPRAGRQTGHRRQGWHDGQMILAITLMTIIAPPCHHGQGPGADADIGDAPRSMGEK